MATPLHCCMCRCKCAQIYCCHHQCMPTLIFPCGCPVKRSPKNENDMDEKYDSPTGSQKYAATEHKKRNSDDNLHSPNLSEDSDDMERYEMPRQTPGYQQRTQDVNDRRSNLQGRRSVQQERYPANRDEPSAIMDSYSDYQDRTSSIQTGHPSIQERRRTPSTKLSVVVKTVESAGPNHRMDDSFQDVRNLDPPHHGQLKTQEASKSKSQYPNQKNAPKFRESTVVVTYANSGHSQESMLPREDGSRITDTEYLLATENLNDNPMMYSRPEKRKSTTFQDPRESRDTRETATSPASIYCDGNASAPGYCYNSECQSPKKLQKMIDKMSRTTSGSSIKEDKKCCPKRSKKHTAIKRKDSHEKTPCCKKKRPKEQKNNQLPLLPPVESQDNFSPKEQYELLSKVADENSKLKKEVSSFYEPPKTKPSPMIRPEPSPVIRTEPSKARPNIQPCRNVGTCTRKRAFLGVGGRPSQISAEMATAEQRGLTVCLCEGKKSRNILSKLRVLKKPPDRMSTTSSTGNTRKCCPCNSKRKTSPKRVDKKTSTDKEKT